MALTETQQQEQKIEAVTSFISMVQDKQIEHSLILSKQSTLKVGNKTYKKRPLTASQWREIAKLNEELGRLPQNSVKSLDKLIEIRTVAAKYYFDIPKEVFEENYEYLSPYLEGNILRSNTGLSPEIDIEKILIEYKKRIGIT